MRIYREEEGGKERREERGERREMGSKREEGELMEEGGEKEGWGWRGRIRREVRELGELGVPIAVTGLIFYVRSMVTMVLLGKVGEEELAGGSLGMAFANITGYSVLSGLALGMEPLCSQAFGAKRVKIMSLTLQRCIIFLLLCSIPISLLWINMSKILVLMHQEANITRMAQTFLLFSLPDLITYSFLHPIRIYLRAQGITHPLTLASLAGTLLHFPLNYILVMRLHLGLPGVAIASAASNLSILLFLLSLTGFHCCLPSSDSFTCWNSLLRLAAPSCISVCLEWWWYEIIIILCGLLLDPTATVASMGILIQTTSLIYVFPSSLGFAVSTRVGNELGANRPSRAKFSALVSVFLAAIMGFSAMFFAVGIRRCWGRIFTADRDIIRITSMALPILGLCELGNCPQTVACGVIRGTARPNTAANVNLAAFYLLGMPVALGLAFCFGLGFCGLWLGLLSAQVCCAGLMLYVIGTTDWEFEAHRAQLLTLVHDERSETAVDQRCLSDSFLLN
ncbi:hypothetical protein VNO78_10172 [Psophocarpus tetragonolobus]|uniref:Protein DETOXIFICATION n=1 Tax=Psophocarpus tetragonolobus TaxID=3891 RepID=A0AAN9SJQ3_PSOTE